MTCPTKNISDALMLGLRRRQLMLAGMTPVQMGLVVRGAQVLAILVGWTPVQMGLAGVQAV
jgi:hypothetical protein